MKNLVNIAYTYNDTYTYIYKFITVFCYFGVYYNTMSFDASRYVTGRRRIAYIIVYGIHRSHMM